MSGESASILARTARGAGWVIGFRMVTRVLGLASTLILVRLMAPDEFGLVALAAAFAVTLEVCLALGVEDQIVRADAPSRELYDTAFTINFVRGLVIGVLLLVSAEPAAQFFAEPRLTWVLWALAASAALSGMASIGVVNFRRELQFDKEFFLNLFPRLAGVVTTVGLAFVLQSHWALVAGILTNRIGVVVMGYVMHPYRPRLTFSAWRQLAGVSAWSWALSVATILRDRSDSFVIGRGLGSAAVGHYSAGIEVAILPATELVDPICRACMSGFAASKRSGEDDNAENYLRILSLLAMFTLPAGLGISLVAGPVVAFAYGQAWLEAVSVIAIIGAGSVLSVFGTVSATMLNAHTRLGTMLAIILMSGVLRLALLLLLTPLYGLAGAAAAVALAALGENVLLVLRALRLLRRPLTSLLSRVWRPAISAAAMCAILWATGLGWAPAPGAAGPAARLLAEGIGLGMLSYGGVALMLWLASGRPRGAETDLLHLVRRALAALQARRLGGSGPVRQGS